MDVAAQMLEARTDERGVDHATLALAIDAMHDVVSATSVCADACMSEPDVADMTDCIRACLDAADVATALIKVLSRTGPTVQGTRALVSAAAKMLAETSAVATRHGDHDKHCRITAETTSRGQQALAGLVAAVAAAEA
jgi:hypothetical protein